MIYTTHKTRGTILKSQFNGSSNDKKKLPKVWSTPSFKALKKDFFFYFK